MQIYYTDKLLSEINNIKNIQAIWLENIPQAKTNHKFVYYPSLSISYDGGKFLSLTYNEKYFDSFVKKVTEVYNDEKNNIYEDKLLDPFNLHSKIDIDDYTKEVLEKGYLSNINELYKFYENKFSYNNSLLFENNELEFIMPIIKYHLEDFFTHTDIVFKMNDSIYGYRTFYNTNAIIDGKEKTLILNYFKVNENEYSIKVSNIFENNNETEINIKFDSYKISVTIENKMYNFYSKYEYLMNEENIKQIVSIYKGSLILHHSNKDLDKTNDINKSITDFDASTSFNWYILPWNALWGINNKVEKINENEKLLQMHSMYLLVKNTSFNKRENYTNTKIIRETPNTKGMPIVLDEMNKNTTCICISPYDNLYIIETAFLDSKNTNGYYKENLNNKYFYHTFISDDLNKKIKDLVNITNSSVTEKADLLNKSKILDLVKGDK